MDIAHQFKEVGVGIDENGLIPTMEKMANASVSSVDPGCVPERQVLHHTGEGDVSHLDEKVDMVRHKAKRVNAVVEPLGSLLEKEVKAVPVGIVEEHVVAGIPAENDMVDGTWIMDTWFTWHDQILIDNV